MKTEAKKTLAGKSPSELQTELEALLREQFGLRMQVATQQLQNTSKLKQVPASAVAAVGDTLREHGLPPPSGGGATFLQAKTANEVLKSQERRLKLQKLKGELVDRARAEALVFRLARETRDAWVNWPARAAALIAAELGFDPVAMQKVLEAHVRAHLDELAEGRIDLS